VPFDVVIAGGGFGGLYAARRLERRLPRHTARLTVVSDVNFLLYTPLLPGAAAGTLEPRHVVVPRPLRYRTLGVFVDMGRNKAVATVLGLRLRGFPAWFAARTYHLAMMPGIARRVRLGIDWAVGLVFGRASAELGQLGHPPSLGDYLDEAARAGETPDR
jgi:NADH dehydrogenase FAD-containing subunit